MAKAAAIKEAQMAAEAALDAKFPGRKKSPRMKAIEVWYGVMGEMGEMGDGRNGYRLVWYNHHNAKLERNAISIHHQATSIFVVANANAIANAKC